MPVIANVSTTWSSAVTLASDEIWPACGGAVRVSTASSSGAKDGIELANGDGLRIAACREVRYLKEGTGTPYIVREMM